MLKNTNRISNNFKIRIADVVFEIVPFNAGTINFFGDYLTAEAADYQIRVTEADLEYEREQGKRTAEIEGRAYGNFSNRYLEFIAISRYISDYISFHNGAMFHGAFIEKEGKGYLFAAKSGTGKTTHIMNWKKQYDDVHIVNGDKPFLRVEKDGVYAYGTPWCGKENLNINKKVKVERLILLERDTINHIEPVHYTNHMNELFTQLYIPQDEEGMARMFKIIHELSQKVKLYRLGCNMDVESAMVAYEGMR